MMNLLLKHKENLKYWGFIAAMIDKNIDIELNHSHSWTFCTPFAGEYLKYVRFACSGILAHEIKEGMNKMKRYCTDLNTTQPV